ncbi:hypothetical protein CABS03_07892 [Colletotrichum abscissum]|uniref:Uncharacterized protein n=1 Tax=Colletotrichum abscissum TaxID=1671311 RepID=A0A9P9XAS1_9PEZI|nr:hypothetical protein CABS02_09661 [Colletotrichum abscissum]
MNGRRMDLLKFWQVERTVGVVDGSTARRDWVVRARGWEPMGLRGGGEGQEEGENGRWMTKGGTDPSRDTASKKGRSTDSALPSLGRGWSTGHGSEAGRREEVKRRADFGC